MEQIDFTGAAVLITGGTGSFGHAFVEHALSSLNPKKLVVFSRDELKQSEMQRTFSKDRYPALRFFIGDVRDRDRLYRALDGINIVVHAAALKQVDTAEYNPLEAIKTNIMGSANLIDAAIDRNVGRVIALSTDKAANPVNLYGATKLCADKLFVAANAYSGPHHTKFSVVRYGNVVGSRGSVIPHFVEQRHTGIVNITHAGMTRFLITLDRGVRFVVRCAGYMQGGEIFVPKIPSVRITDLARVIAPECEQRVIGIRPGEKLHEVMVPEDDARLTLEYDDHFVIHTAETFRRRNDGTRPAGKPCAPGFRYGSDNNVDWLNDGQIAELVASFSTPESPGAKYVGAVPSGAGRL